MPPTTRSRSAQRLSNDEAKARTRAALIAAGLELFAQHGLDGPSLDAICEHAGFTRGAFYVHFRDRDDFLVAVMETVGLEVLDALLGSGGVDLQGMMERFVGAVRGAAYPLMGRGEGHARVRPHQLLHACARSPAIRARYLALVAESTSRMKEGARLSQRRGTVRADVDADLGAPLDLSRAAPALLTLLAPPAAAKGKRRPRAKA